MQLLGGKKKKKEGNIPVRIPSFPTSSNLKCCSKICYFTVW